MKSMMNLLRFFVAPTSLAMFVLTACDTYDSYSRSEGDTCDESSDCTGSLLCLSGICTDSGGSGECPNGCPSGSTCVENEGCLWYCNSNSECESGCCAGLTSGDSVCASAQYCGGSSGSTSGGSTSSGGGTTCNNRTNCVGMTATHPTGAGNCNGEIVGHFQNNCGEGVQCRFCVVENGSVTSDCGYDEFVPVGDSGGELGGVWSCNKSSNSGYAYLCMHVDDPFSCLNF